MYGRFSVWIFLHVAIPPSFQKVASTYVLVTETTYVLYAQRGSPSLLALAYTVRLLAFVISGARILILFTSYILFSFHVILFNWP